MTSWVSSQTGSLGKARHSLRIALHHSLDEDLVIELLFVGLGARAQHLGGRLIRLFHRAPRGAKTS